MVRFHGNDAFDDYTLSTGIVTSRSDWTYALPLLRHLGLGRRRPFDELEFRRDVLRLALFYRLRGFYDAQVDTLVRRTDGSVAVTFRIVEGLPVRVDSVRVGVLGDTAATAGIVRRVTLRPGDRFDRLVFAGAADTVALQFRNRGYPFAQVYSRYDVDRTTRLADVGFEVVPGPRARVGEVRIEGLARVSPRTVRRFLAFRDGEWFSQDALYVSQLALYQTELFRYASVAVAPDSVVRGADSLVRVRVQVQEAAATRLRIGAGYGTIDCIRSQASWTAVGFPGGATRVNVSGRVTKIGVGSPTAMGLGNSLCPALADDPFSERVNYLGSVAVQQPFPLFRQSLLTVSGFAERMSEYKAYERQGLGAAVEMSFGVGRLIPVTVAYRLRYGRTVADPATFCTFFDRCEQSTIALLSERRREAALVLSASRSRVNSVMDPSDGSVISAGFTHASPLVGSDSLMVFNKFVAEAAWYGRMPGLRRWVLALRVRGGIIRPGLAFVADSNIRFVPPDERFYAGGPNTVRGFPRNELGPIVYVADSVRVDAGTGEVAAFGLRTSPLGSYAVLLANAEARFRSPLLPNRLRLAAFVDVGRLWDQSEHGLVSAGFRLTPGVGVRVVTPLGPMRLDVAYNDYPQQRGPLYVTVPATATEPGRLDLVRDDYSRPPRRESFFGKLQLQFSVGQAF